MCVGATHPDPMRLPGLFQQHPNEALCSLTTLQNRQIVLKLAINAASQPRTRTPSLQSRVRVLPGSIEHQVRPLAGPQDTDAIGTGLESSRREKRPHHSTIAPPLALGAFWDTYLNACATAAALRGAERPRHRATRRPAAVLSCRAPPSQASGASAPRCCCCCCPLHPPPQQQQEAPAPA
jgi:hypothetical protein